MSDKYDEADFRREYMQEFVESPVYKALKKSYGRVANKDTQLFLPQAIIKNGLESLRHGVDESEVLIAVIESMSSLVNDFYKQLIEVNKYAVRPIFVEKP